MINRLWLIVFLTIIWCGFSGSFYLPTLMLGLFFAVIIHYLVMPNKPNFRVNLWHLLLLALLMLWELFRSSIEVAWEIITPNYRHQAEFITINLVCQHPVQISLLSNLISLTPGTLAVDLKHEHSELVLHIMFANEQKHLDFIKHTLEPRIMKVIQHD